MRPLPPYNAANNSLFVVGPSTTRQWRVIPAIWHRDGAAALKDPLAGKLIRSEAPVRASWKPGAKNKLYVTAFVFYDADNAQSTAFSRSLTLSDAATGPRPSPQRRGFLLGYMGTIPAEWQGLFGGLALTGNCCLSIINHFIRSLRLGIHPEAPRGDGANAGAIHRITKPWTYGAASASGVQRHHSHYRRGVSERHGVGALLRYDRGPLLRRSPVTIRPTIEGRARLSLSRAPLWATTPTTFWR